MPAFPVDTSGANWRGLAAYSCGGSHGHRSDVCSLLGPERHRRTGIMPFFEQYNDAAAFEHGPPQRFQTIKQMRIEACGPG